MKKNISKLLREHILCLFLGLIDYKKKLISEKESKKKIAIFLRNIFEIQHLIFSLLFMRITYIDGLEKEVQCTSVTRRSAGIPMLVRSIVSSEKRGSSGGRHLLSTAVKRLLGGNRVNFGFF